MGRGRGRPLSGVRGMEHDYLDGQPDGAPFHVSQLSLLRAAERGK
jgi:hypothetical protein